MSGKLKEALNSYGLARTIITSFFIALCILSAIVKIPFAPLISDILIRTGMNGILVLAMVPTIISGIGLNFGLPLGVLCGILGVLTAIEMNLSGAAALVFAIVMAVPLAAIMGWAYGWLLNKVKGSEMMVATYVGFSAVSLMNIAWILLPFKSLELKWPIGQGLRTTINLAGRLDKVLNDFLMIRIGTFYFSVGLFIVVLFFCFLMWLFLRSKAGMAMKAVGDSRQFAIASGLNVDKYRTLGAVISTVLGAVGIVIFVQSFGFMQLYEGPMFLGFVSVAAILIGGATVKKASITHVLIGAFLFQGMLAIAPPVANTVISVGNMAEITGSVVRNGVILYALAQVGGGE